MKNIYQHCIELKTIRISNADKTTFSQKLIDLPYRGYEVEELSKIFLTLMERTYNGEEPSNFINEIRVLNFTSGETSEALIKAYKWIWGQEDVNYPNGEGRLMFWKAYQEIIANL